MKFSQRMGFVQVNNVIQLDSVNSDLRSDLRNFVYLAIGKGDDMRQYLWAGFLKKPIDEYSFDLATTYFKDFFFSCNRYEIYDVLEFILRKLGYYQGSSLKSSGWESGLNEILTKNLSGYRFLNGVCAPITDPQELESIQLALSCDDKFLSAREHMITALQHLSHKTNPDFRNSIKESISAVEAIVRLICEDPKITLGEGIKRLKSGDNHVINRVLLEGLDKLYARTNTEGGARHAMNEGDDVLGLDDAKFMLVTCSAFVNYFIAKGFK